MSPVSLIRPRAFTAVLTTPFGRVVPVCAEPALTPSLPAGLPPKVTSVMASGVGANRLVDVHLDATQRDRFGGKQRGDGLRSRGRRDDHGHPEP